MLERESAINKFQLGVFSLVVKDIASENLYTAGSGHGHSPIWLLGHLAICAEIGQGMLGGAIEHDSWLPIFGAGSSGQVERDASFSKDGFVDATITGYEKLQALAMDPAAGSLLELDHGFAPFANTPISNVGDFVGLLLTNHFGFHLAQLSSCRRERGHSYLF
ncbi:DinB family protein [Aureliella helgolandensis]|uniref:DinB superfamily protein n=1 Tax=Aureliella helgolandensis TaxID=2527968 RepID=A0A518G5K3_9BACT|nr:DinB family protein [Aureliella helgolandensis]QDV23870.1 hypothetical protein Q31a_21790 [Aureliella helgolandensis]